MSKTIKCIVWDLDEILWEGTLVEGDELTLRPGILQILKELDARGILNSIASRNQESEAVKILKKFEIFSYFVSPQINFNLKADNLVAISKELNIGIDSLAFIDDSPFERDGISHAYPEVLVLKPKDYLQLNDLPEFNTKNMTDESKDRKDFYQNEEERIQEEIFFQGSRLEFLRHCQINLTLRLAQVSDIPRILELSARTNQFNSTGVEHTQEQIEGKINHKEYYVVVAELADKFGKYGNIGVMILKIEEKAGIIENLMISCRAAGRGVSAAMMILAMKITSSHQSNMLITDYRENERNRQLGIFYSMMGFISHKNNIGYNENHLIYDLLKYPIPDNPNWINLNILMDQEGI